MYISNPLRTQTLDTLLGDLGKVAGRLDKYAETKDAEIADHQAKAAALTLQIRSKSTERDRAARIRGRLAELLG